MNIVYRVLQLKDEKVYLMGQTNERHRGLAS